MSHIKSAGSAIRKTLNVTILTIITFMALASPFVMFGSQAGATSPGYNGKIVYRSSQDGNNEIYTLDSDGSDITRLTFYGADASQPNWSPDGSKIVYKSNADGNNEIYTMNADGSNKVKLTNNTFDDREPSWALGGNKIVFVSNRDGNFEVYIMNANGSNQTRLTNNVVPDDHPKVAPNGQTIAFHSLRSSNYDIYTINIDGSNEVRLTTEATVNARPKWSPDGSKIIYVGSAPGNNEIFIMNANGSNPVRLTYDAANDNYPAISPDGASIVFTSNRSGDDELYIMSIEGSNITQITSETGIEIYADWQTVPNIAPIVTTDSATTSHNTAAIVDVLVNDTDEENLDPANLTISVQPTHGVATISSGKINYIPTTNFSGTDQLTYQICDSFMLDQKCATGTLSITVQAPPPPDITVMNVNGETHNPSTSQHETSNLRPTFSGTATPGAEITIEIHSDPIILTTTADSNGNWSVTPTFDLPSGAHMVYISATLNGLTTSLGAFGLSIGGLAATGSSIWIILVSAIGLISLSCSVLLKLRLAQNIIE